MSPVRVDVLVFEGCPHTETALERVRQVANGLTVPPLVRVLQVEDDAQAQELRFLGSPTVQVDGKDVEPGAAQRQDYVLQCRVYSIDGRLEGAPPVEWILAAILGASSA